MTLSLTIFEQLPKPAVWLDGHCERSLDSGMDDLEVRISSILGKLELLLRLFQVIIS